MNPSISDLGACPVCGDLVSRTFDLSAGRMAETYECPRHGTVTYGAPVPLSQWAAGVAADPTPLAVHDV